MAFYTLIALTSISAVAILVVRSVLHAALCLIVCLLGIAGLYVILDAEFLAVVQILIYAGGILLLIIFGIMITRRAESSQRRLQIPGLVLGLVMMVIFWYALQDMRSLPTNGENVVTGQQIGTSMMTSYAAPFEAGGLLLLVSLIGAMLTSTFRSRS